MRFRLKWFSKTKRPLPEDKICRNCGAQMMGRYCQDCGQDIFSGTGMPIFKLIVQVLDNVFAFEGKTPRTLTNLLIRPGFLSNEYMNGRIIRYVNPVKLFWMSTLIFFTLFIFKLDNSNWQNNTNVNIKIGELNMSINSHSDTIAHNSEIENNNKLDNEKEKQEKLNIVSNFIHFFVKIAPYVSFLFIPFFGLLLALFFWRNKYYYVYHLIFTIHFHAFLGIFFSLILISKIFFTFSYPSWCQTILFITPGIYFVFALHHFYHYSANNFNSWCQTIWKSLLITFTYFILISIISSLIIVLYFKVKYPEL